MMAPTATSRMLSTCLLVLMFKPNQAFQIHLPYVSRTQYSSNIAASSELYQSMNDSGSNQQLGLNEVQTLLRQAVEREDYKEAARLRDILRSLVDFSKVDSKKLSWQGLGAAPWLVDRLNALKLGLPTTIQVNAFESVNSMLLDSAKEKNAQLDEEFLEDRVNLVNRDMGIVISGSTGSGKSNAFLVPMLSTLSEALFTRQRLRVKAEEDIGDAVDDLLERVAVTTSPAILSKQNSQVGGRDGRAALATMGKGSDVKSPLALIVVPTRELGVQLALNLFELVGGNTRRTKTDLYAPGSTANMFKYKGPRGVKIGCVLDESEAEDGLKLQTDVAITTPQFLGRLLDEGDIEASKLRVVIFDEADLGLEMIAEDVIDKLFESSGREMSRLTYLVGASVTDSLANNAIVKGKMLPEGASYIATAASFNPISWDDAEGPFNDGSAENKASIKSLVMQLDRGLVHERCVIPEDSYSSGLLILCRMLRKELRDYTDRMNEAISTNTTDITKIERPRVVIFFPNEDEARSSMSKLRDALWGDYKLGVLLPNTGNSPLQIMEQFKFNETGVLLATPNSVRGLDFSGLTHVYTLYMPVDTREYLHLAGRVGRVGQTGSSSGKGGKVTSIIRARDVASFEQLTKQFGFVYNDIEYIRSDVAEINELNQDNIEDVRRYLEDLLGLLE
uniref:RNA helicase n=1 Tax=Leptocylindrus danicus TaxID=163516 RepID=A0A7S2JR01_9STRA